MSGIPREVIEHKLGIDPAFKPIKQKESRYTPERCETIQVEVNKLLEARFIRSVHYPSWLANPVLVEKPDGSRCMCNDYTSLNKSCSKDEYPMPRICQIMDLTATYEPLSYLDAYSGYHQISLVTDDEEKASFITSFGIFYYTKMAFRLKNGGATYQKCVPRRVLIDNGTQFQGAKFIRCCTNFSIQHQPSSTVDPQTNGQVERTN
jgi:hypothetical protein